jgi:hypothetical protein
MRYAGAEWERLGHMPSSRRQKANMTAQGTVTWFKVMPPSAELQLEQFLGSVTLLGMVPVSSISPAKSPRCTTHMWEHVEASHLAP